MSTSIGTVSVESSLQAASTMIEPLLGLVSLGISQEIRRIWEGLDYWTSEIMSKMMLSWCSCCQRLNTWESPGSLPQASPPLARMDTTMLTVDHQDALNYEYEPLAKHGKSSNYQLRSKMIGRAGTRGLWVSLESLVLGSYDEEEIQGYYLLPSTFVTTR